MPVGRGCGEHGRRKKKPTLLTPPPLPKGISFSPGLVELNDRHLRSHEKIGDCEQSIFDKDVIYWDSKSSQICETLKLNFRIAKKTILKVLS